MSGINKVIAIGNLGRDPEVRTIPQGTKVANFSIAVTEKYKDKEVTEWIKCVVWKGLADITERYLRKGSQVYIEGKLRTRSWDDQDGVKKYTTEVIVDQMQMLGGKRNDNTNDQSAAVPEPREDTRMPPAPEDDLPF